jgi:hypothetical protein
VAQAKRLGSTADRRVNPMTRTPTCWLRGYWTWSDWLAGTITLSLSGAGSAFANDPDGVQKLRFALETSTPLAGAAAASGLWHLERVALPEWITSPRHHRSPWTAVPAATVLGFTPNLVDPADLAERVNAAELLAEILASEPALRVSSAGLIDWAIAPALAPLATGRVADLGTRARTDFAATARALRAPYLAPYIAGRRYVRDLEAFREMHTGLSPAEAALVATLVRNYGGRLWLDGGTAASRKTRTAASRLAIRNWCTTSPGPYPVVVRAAGLARRLHAEEVLAY